MRKLIIMAMAASLALTALITISVGAINDGAAPQATASSQDNLWRGQSFFSADAMP
jgi:hypothetical protein